MPMRLQDLSSSIVAVVEPETSALVAAQLMRQHQVGALVVVDSTRKNHPVGMVTDRDLVLALMAEGLDPAVFTVGDIMSVDPVLADSQLDAIDAIEMMRLNRLRRLIVIDQSGRLTGIATMEDVLELLARELTALAVGLRGARDREFEQRK